jgi:hypothetical protein
MEHSQLNSVKLSSEKLLYKYQYGFLVMQRFLTALFKITKAFAQRKVFKSLNTWKSKIFNPKPIINLHIVAFKLNLILSEYKFKHLLNKNICKHFLKMISYSEIKKICTSANTQYKRMREESKNELKTAENQAKVLKINLVDSQATKKPLGKKEISSKQKFKKLNQIKEFDNQIRELENLKNENFNLEKEIKELDLRTVSLFKELNSALDRYELRKKNKHKKTKKRISITSRKSILSVCS